MVASFECFIPRNAIQIMDKVNKRALRAVYQDWGSFEELLEVDVKIHTRNLRTLMTEVFISGNKLNPMFM